MLPVAFLTAVTMLVLWFPVRTLWHQQTELNAAAQQIAAIQQQGTSLKAQARSVSSRTAATLLAREQYQLVSPGQSLIQVLPGDGSGYVAATTGDPGFQPLASPLSSTSLPSNATPAASKSGGANSFVARLVRTLEFWR